MDTSSALPEIDETAVATTRYLAALTQLDDESAGRPSGLPGWTRAHVVAHVSRNADALTRVLTAASAGRPASMYDAPQARDDDIEETVRAHDLAGLVEDAHRSSQRLESAWRTCHADPATPYTRLSQHGDEDEDEASFPLVTIGPRRRAEVEIHHSDLELGYLPTDWPAHFALSLVGQRQEEMSTLPQGCPSMVLSSTDVPGLWKLGAGQGPEIHGAAGDLAWWLVGRGGGRGLTCSAGQLPVLDRWR